MTSLFKRITGDFQTPQSSNDQPRPNFSVRSQHLVIEDLQLEGFIGILEHEKQNKQRIVINAKIEVSPTIETQTDKIESVLSYMSFVEDVKKIMQRGHIDLVETLASEIIKATSRHKGVRSINLSIKKPDIVRDASGVGVSVEASF